MCHPKPISVRPLPVAGEKAFYRVGLILMVVGALYWARDVFLPLALAVLFAFALTPVAGWLQRRHLGRVTAALISTAAAIALVAGVLAVAEQQTERLVRDLRGETYQKNIAHKLAPVLELVHRLDRVENAVTPEKPTAEPPKPTDQPTPVLVKETGTGVLGWLPSLARPLAEVVTTLLLMAVGTRIASDWMWLCRNRCSTLVEGHQCASFASSSCWLLPEPPGFWLTRTRTRSH